MKRDILDADRLRFSGFRILRLFAVSCVFFICGIVFQPSFINAQPQEVPFEEIITSKEFVRMAWEISNQRDLAKLEDLVRRCLKSYGDEANKQQALLTGFPTRGDEAVYQVLNDVATCLFIKAEAVMNSGKTEQAIKEFQYIIDTYKWAQAWDPRGWYWSVREKSQASIDVLTGKAREDEEENSKRYLSTKPFIYTKGTDKIVDYAKYGKVVNEGTKDYHYSIADRRGLIKAVGEGVYPNDSDIFRNPRYKEVRKEGRLKGNHWDFVNSSDLEAAYFKWVSAPEPWGTKLFYLGMIFEKAGMYETALKAYHSLVMHFPGAVAWTYWQTPWYPGQAAIAKIKHIVRSRPELNLEVMDMHIQIINGFDNDVKNDEIITSPGAIIRKPERVRKVDLGKVTKEIGSGHVRLVQYENGHWQMLVDNEPYVIKGITYEPTKIGQSPDKGTLVNWMEEDTNNNGRVDGPYDSWVDVNKNNVQDKNEPVVGDFQLMKEMGVNTLRIYHQPQKPDKAILRDMFEKYGIRVIMGDFFGKYAIGSGAGWSEGTDYENPEHRKNMLASVQKMVMEHKDEPYVLMWLLGNENNYGVACNADKKPEAYFQFADEVAQWIKSVDSNHPVAVNNGDTLFLDVFAKYSPHIDIFSANVYRGNYGFGSFWEQVLNTSGKPAFITEYGCPSYAKHLTFEDAEEAQAEYHKGNWLDIEDNLAGTRQGIGNALGGVAFEWLDEWWKNYEPYRHDKKSDAVGPFPGGYYFEEWFGIVSQGKGEHSPFLRQLRKTYFIYQELWRQN